MMEWLFVGVGGGLGAVLRYSVMRMMMKYGKPSFWSTATVNVLGSFLIGLSAPYLTELDYWSQFLVIGLLGAFTTFSTFSFDLVKMFERKNWKNIIFYLIVNLGGGLLFFALGWVL